MAKRSNKTSHVLDLITKSSNSSDTDEDEALQSRPGWMPPPSEEFTLEQASPVPPNGNYEDSLVFAEREKKQSSETSKSPHNDLKSMINQDVDDDDPVADKLRHSLEAYIRHEASGDEGKEQSRIFIEGDGTIMENTPSLRHALSNLGNEYSAGKLDSVESDDLQNTSLAADLNDESNASHEKSGQYIFVNVAEEIVRSKVPSMMKDFHMCTCERCTNDVVALTLNKMPPKYVVTMKGKLYARINACLPQYQTDLITAITSACNTVQMNSRHSAQTYQEHLANNETK